ncbi:DgyrCDS2318 [Dimorphilus gyrociliatus]|uniref:DgyrCDS2318 n=1 Tax=Dimorphilus gyrociliatus TaxID=2664684 RepID=A0A7I8V9W9_9ANNE|nr:DgyrCDS2318 [Dimorphilus gyrociliatus]
MARVPGKIGYPLIGDESYEFYKDYHAYISKKFEHYGNIFCSRFLNKPTVFIGTHMGVRQLLNSQSNDLEMGYKSFMDHIFSDNILFASDFEAENLRRDLISIFSPQCLENCEEASFATEICQTVFLDLDASTAKETAEAISKLTTSHWHGLISVPVNLRLPGIKQSGYSKAIDAKNQLLKWIKDRLKTSIKGFPLRMKETFDEESAASHLLLFSTSLVPKAISSLICSFLLQATAEENFFEKISDQKVFDAFIKEIYRYYPPILGGRRIAKKDLIIDGYRIPENHSIVYLTHSANRDQMIFENGNTFNYERWLGDKDKPCIFTFGTSRRNCIGIKMVSIILETTCKLLLKEFTWTSNAVNDFQYKPLPISRPVDGYKCRFIPKGTI